jgi:penicillin-binding protein 2
MSRPLTIRNSLHENRLFLNRAVASVLIMAAASVGLVSRLIYLQVVGHEHYSMLSRDNRVKISPLPPPRGLILDRNGEILADNMPTYSLEIIPEQTPNLRQTLSDLAKLLDLREEEVSRFESLRKKHKVFDTVPLRQQLTEEEVARFSVKMPYFPGVELHSRLLRTYPYGELTAHIVGYVGRINEAELQKLDPAMYSGTYHIGKTGVEKTYETELHGKAGYEEIEINVQGRSINVLSSTEPLAGKDLRLSLDIRLQKVASDALETFNGAVVAMEPETGKVLAFVSKPSFDPNPFIHGIGREAYGALNASPERPLYNRALRGQYPPGSTIKPFVALAGLEAAQIGPARRVICPGYYLLPGVSHRYRDWRKGGHGAVDMRNAIVQSCDVYFYDLAHHIGIDRLHAFLKPFGFGELTGIDLAGEKAGLFPSQKWKKKARKERWYPGETLIAGIGQGYVHVTPVQLARSTAILANRGKIIEPHFVEPLRRGQAVEPPDDEGRARSIELAPESWKLVTDSMVEVVHGPRGTAHGISGGLSYKIAGKTGTAQVFSVGQNQTYKGMKVDDKLRDHALFISFAPADAPRIAVAVVAENGGHGGSVAAPIARKVIEHYLGGQP